MTTDSHIIATVEKLQERADYVAGLRRLADLLDEHTTLPLPHNRDLGLVFVDSKSDLMTYADAMTAWAVKTEGDAAYACGLKGRILELGIDVRIRDREMAFTPVVTGTIETVAWVLEP